MSQTMEDRVKAINSSKILIQNHTVILMKKKVKKISLQKKQLAKSRNHVCYGLRSSNGTYWIKTKQR